MAPRASAVYAVGVRPLVLAGLLALLVPAVVAGAAHDAAADFEAGGRGKKPKKPPKPGGAGKAQPPAAKPGKGDGDETKGASRDTLIARYTAIVLAQPAAPFPAQRLAQLYRERDGNLKKLVEDFEKRAAATDDSAWNAKVALAAIYRQDGRFDEAIKTYEGAIAERPRETSPLLALAQLELDRNEPRKARGHYEQALGLMKVAADVESTTRTLMGICLDLSDFDAAKKHHDALVKSAAGSLFVKAELGRELLSRGQFERAEGEFREVVKAASGDNRALAPALRDLGQALAKQKKLDEALSTLKKALAAAGGASGVRNEILLVMTDAYRADGKLSELIGLLEAERGQDFQRLATLGGLYEETGDVDKALATYRKALAADGKHIDVRVRLVHLLQTAGDLDGAVREYEALIKAAPNNADFVFELCETLIQRGDRPKALKLLGELESRVANEPEILATVADFYERVQERERSLRVLQKLAAAGGGDPAHIIDLGDRYFQTGDKKKALETWARIKSMVPNRARAAATLGEVYLDHDLVNEALTSLREAVQLEPGELRYKKSLASALERTASAGGNATARYAEARAIWEELLSGAKNDKVLAREARSHVVSLWALTRELAGRVAPLTARFGQKPPDLEAGRLLAEVHKKLHRLADAEATLRRLATLTPGDEEVFLALERVLVQRQNLAGAIEVLGKLVDIQPKRAREFYQRMAQYAAELYKDDDAIKYAARAVELSPEDATGHQKLGDMYRRRQDVPHAIAEYRAAIAKNDRLFVVYFDLAELLMSTGQVDEADRLFRRVVRASNDEELVARAARLSMQVNLGRGTLDSLERELLPVAVGNPQRPIYRRLLVELYGAMTFPLVQKAKGTRAESPSGEAKAARDELSRIGARAVKPLLDALADDKESQQKIAIEVLAYVENRAAGPALLSFAQGTADKTLRVRAMIACGMLRDAALLPRYEQLLTPKDGMGTLPTSDSIAIAAAWSVARLGDRKAEPLLVKLLGSASPDVRATAAIGLGLGRDKKHAPMLTALARSPEAGPVARAAAILALGELGAPLTEHVTLLLSAAEAPSVVERQAAISTLARLSDPADAGRAADAIASAVFATDESLRSDALIAAVVLASKTHRRSADPLRMPDGALTAREILAGLRPDAPGADERARALSALAPALARAAVAAVSTSPERARVVADVLQGIVGSTPAGAPDAGAGDKQPLERALASIGAAVVPGFAALIRHPDVAVRIRAVELLARRSEPAAEAAVVDALADPDDEVRRAALAAIGAVPSRTVARAVSLLLTQSSSWALRVRAAEALGRLGRARGVDSDLTAELATALTAAARADSYALVREAAFTALAIVDEARARPVLAEVAARDPEPLLRSAARKLLSKERDP